MHQLSHVPVEIDLYCYFNSLEMNLIFKSVGELKKIIFNLNENIYSGIFSYRIITIAY